jgi:hypothetical protein
LAVGAQRQLSCLKKTFQVFGDEGRVGRHYGQTVKGVVVMQVEIAVAGVTLGLVCHGDDPLSEL